MNAEFCSDFLASHKQHSSQCARRRPALLALTLAAVLLLSATPALAQRDYSQSLWFLGLGVGRFSPDVPGPGEKSATSAFLAAGSRINRYVALAGELLLINREFGGVGGTEKGRAEVTTTGFGALVKLYWPLERLEPYLGLGYGSYRAEITAEASSFGLPAGAELGSTTTRALSRAVGLEWALTERASVGLEYRELPFRESATVVSTRPSVPFGVFLPGTLTTLTFFAYF